MAWRLLPSNLPPKSTAYRWFSAWRDRDVFEALNHALLMIDRERNGRSASPSACIIDSQSAKTNETGGPRGYDSGKKVMGGTRIAVEIVRRKPDQIGFAVQPRRWVVERFFFAWINRNRRLRKDAEATIA